MKLIKEKEVHYYLGISKEDAKSIIKDRKDVPHVVINGNVYFPKKKLKKWISNLE